MWYRFRSNDAAMHGSWQFIKIPKDIITEEYNVGDYLIDLGCGVP